MNYRLYILYSTKDFLIRYVGITGTSLDKRLYYHIKDSKRKRTYKEKWINNCLSNNFEIRIKTIKKFNDLESLKDSEINLIKFLTNKNYKLTNSTVGGDGLLNPSKEVRLKISNARKVYKWKEESKIKLSNSKKGKPSAAKGLFWKNESRLKLSISKTGKPSNNQKPILQFDLENNFIKKWSTISEAADFHNILITSIVNNLKGKSKKCNNYVWKYE